MAKVDLTAPEHQVIGEVLHAFASGHFVPINLMTTLLGYGLQDVKALAEAWETTHWSEMTEDQIKLVGAVFATMCAYPHDNWGWWYRYVYVSPQRAEHIFEKWAYLTS